MITPCRREIFARILERFRLFYVFTDIGGYNRIVWEFASHIMGLREIQVLIQVFTHFFLIT